MTQLADQTDFAEKLHIVAFTIDTYQGNLQCDFNTLHRVTGFPHFAAAASSEKFDQLILAQSLARSQAKVRRLCSIIF